MLCKLGYDRISTVGLVVLNDCFRFARMVSPVEELSVRGDVIL